MKPLEKPFEPYIPTNSEWYGTRDYIRQNSDNIWKQSQQIRRLSITCFVLTILLGALTGTVLYGYFNRQPVTVKIEKQQSK